MFILLSKVFVTKLYSNFIIVFMLACDFSKKVPHFSQPSLKFTHIKLVIQNCVKIHSCYSSYVNLH